MPLLAASVPAQAPLRPGRLPDWGIYQDIWWEGDYGPSLGRVASALGARPKYVMFFRDLRHGFPARALDAAAALGATPIASLELHEWRHRDGPYLPRINAGEYDDFFRAWAKGAAAWGRPLLLRFGFEMNGGWFGWSGDPEAFKRAWIRVHGIFAAGGARNVLWLFSPNVAYGGKDPAADILPYYPGPEYVDWVGLDGYNFGDHHDKYHKWQGCADVFGASWNWLAGLGKPMMVSEVGCADDGRKADWLRDFLAKVEADRRVRAFIYFNYDKRSEGEPDWSLASDSATLAVFRGWVAGAR